MMIIMTDLDYLNYDYSNVGAFFATLTLNAMNTASINVPFLLRRLTVLGNVITSFSLFNESFIVHRRCSENGFIVPVKFRRLEVSSLVANLIGFNPI